MPVVFGVSKSSFLHSRSHQVDVQEHQHSGFSAFFSFFFGCLLVFVFISLKEVQKSKWFLMVFSWTMDMETTLYNPLFMPLAFVDVDRIWAHQELHGFGFLCWKNGLPWIRYRNIFMIPNPLYSSDFKVQNVSLGAYLNVGFPMFHGIRFSRYLETCTAFNKFIKKEL